VCIIYIKSFKISVLNYKKRNIIQILLNNKLYHFGGFSHMTVLQTFIYAKELNVPGLSSKPLYF